MAPNDLWPRDHSEVAEALLSRGIPTLVLRGLPATENQPIGRDRKTVQVLVPRTCVDAAIAAIEPFGWRYSWVRRGLRRLLPMAYYWWDGGIKLEILWGSPIPPMPAASLRTLTNALWRGATPDTNGFRRPDQADLLAFLAVQACRPGRGLEEEWLDFVNLRSSMADLSTARATARKVGVSTALERAVAAADGGSQRPGAGPLYDGVLDLAWRVAMAVQRRVRPHRISRLLIGQPWLGDASIRCRVRGVELVADAGVFVPTPDADIIIDVAIERLTTVARPTVVEIGTGCGAIALAVAHARPDAAVYAADLSRAATKCAERNARMLGLDYARFYTGPLLEPVPHDLDGRVQLVIANLPFYPARNYAGIGSVPRETIQGEDEDGLGLLRKLARGALAVLRPGGSLILQMFAWQWDRFSTELSEIGYRPDKPHLTGPFAIGSAEFTGRVN